MRLRLMAGWALAVTLIGSRGQAQQQVPIQWRYSLGGICASSPALNPSGDTIYVGVEFGGARNGRLLAIPSDGGPLRWPPYQRPKGAIQSSPAIGKDGTIYVGCGDNFLVAINPANGTQLWQYDAHGFIYSSPAIGADRSE